MAASAATVSTGACDPLTEVREIADRFDLWMHVEASYAASPSLQNRRVLCSRASTQPISIALDPHKWLYLPVDCGCVIYRDAEAARSTFAHDPIITRVI